MVGKEEKFVLITLLIVASIGLVVVYKSQSPTSFVVQDKQEEVVILQQQCGNGVLDEGEECDDGKHCSDGTPCSSDPECMGVGDELCQTRKGDGCSANCLREFCGDGIIDPDGPNNQLGDEDDEQCERDFVDPGCSDDCVACTCDVSDEEPVNKVKSKGF